MTKFANRILIEAPLEWMKSKISSEALRAGEYFAFMVSAASELGLTVETTPALMYSDAAPRLPENGQVCISYHSYGDEENVWRVKEGYLPGYFTLDRLGYSGFSELSRYPDRFRSAIDDFDLERARKIVRASRVRFLDANVSKYDQPESVNFRLPSSYVFFPLQTVHDTVQQFSRVSQIDAIHRISDLCAYYETHLVIKRHPFCNDHSTAAVLEDVTRSPWVTLVDGPINLLIAGAKSVFGGNSGVLFEALLAGKPVFSYASSDFMIATQQLRDAEDFVSVFTGINVIQEGREKFLGWYLSEYCFDLYSASSMVQRMKRLTGCNSSMSINEFSRKQIKEIYAEAELARRDSLTNTHKLVSLNMLRDAYNAGAREKLKFGFSSSKNEAVVKMLPYNQRTVLRQDYYERMHAEEEGYIEKNWLVEYLPSLLKVEAKHLVEVGCGNGKFLRRAAPAFDRITGCDWVETLTLPLEIPNVDFKKVDLTKGGVPKADILCSADVLEHLPVESVLQVLDSLVAASPLQFHVIACYDDGHSHLTVLDPATWLALFRRIMPNAWLFDISARFNDSTRVICVITNVPFSTIGDPPGVGFDVAVNKAASWRPDVLPSPL